jgi:hypothetical protein
MRAKQWRKVWQLAYLDRQPFRFFSAYSFNGKIQRLMKDITV